LAKKSQKLKVAFGASAEIITLWSVPEGSWAKKSQELKMAFGAFELSCHFHLYRG